MNQAVQHRGPDASGVYEIGQGCGAAGHVRLSIIDVSERSDQPFVSADGQVILAFNGEVINANELKVSLDYEFQTTSDTEVLLAGYLIHGPAFFAELVGMFAAQIVDLRRNEIILVRDEFGIKPLWYWSDADRLLVASEERGIEAVMPLPENPEYHKWYLGFRFNPAFEGHLRGSREVEPGTYYTWNVGGDYLEFRKERFAYCYQPYDSSQPVDEKYLLTELERRFEKSLSQWSVSDVPITSFLSSGIDSALIVDGLWKRGLSVSAYTACFDQLGYSEREAVERFCNRRGIQGNVLSLTRRDFLEQYDRYSKLRSGYAGVANEVAIACLSESIARDYKVVFSGEGADELFGGYGRLFRFPEDWSGQTGDFLVSEEFILEFTRKYNYAKHGVSWQRIGRNQAVVEEEFAHYLNDSIASENAFGWVQEFFQTIHLRGLLQRLDFATMSASIEGRPVFLHKELWRWANESVPRELKLKWMQGTDEASIIKRKKAVDYSGVDDIPKYLLRELAVLRLNSDEAQIQKIGFPVPFMKWTNFAPNFSHLEGLGDAEAWLNFNINS